MTEADAARAKEILLGLGSMNPPNPNEKYRTKHFMEFVVDGVDIDVMAGFIIVEEGTEYYCSLRQDQIADFAEVCGVKVPLQSVRLWREYYRLMGRDGKVEMIDAAARS